MGSPECNELRVKVFAMLATRKASVILFSTLLHAGLGSEPCVKDAGGHKGHHGVQGLMD